VGRVSKTARADLGTCATASTAAADKILMLLMTLEENREYAKINTAKTRIMLGR
jgi:hypothetical protein